MTTKTPTSRHPGEEPGAASPRGAGDAASPRDGPSGAGDAASPRDGPSGAGDAASPRGGARDAAIAWRRAAHASVCDRIAPWEHGHVVALTIAPDYYDYNAVRVEGPDPGIDAGALLAAVDRLQEGLAHRRVEFDDPAAGARLAPALVGRGFVHERLAWMLRAAPPPAAAPGVEEVPFSATRDLRGRWHRGEAWAGQERAVLDFLDRQDEVAARRGERAFAVRAAGRPIAFAALLTGPDAVEIEQVFVAPGRRGAGLGTKLVDTALAAGDRDTAWIVADDGGRAKRLYERLGFATVWRQHAFVRYPESRPPA